MTHALSRSLSLFFAIGLPRWRGDAATAPAKAVAATSNGRSWAPPRAVRRGACRARRRYGAVPYAARRVVNTIAARA
ncbi:hypothetical protein E2R23_28590 [Burkholderia pseudomallei]|nr:hypothetical protein CNX72_11130 [Burkholderia pseudomallei]EEH23845.1 hypothetical protein BUH_2467 [Burkholderia pseudomallei Pakistan 9]PJO56735.1 hypothetical protein CWD85_25700 [Burkholderia pseudomallei]QBL81481.1 hypothetical protein EYA82_28405 [Burkholderia pseudomallei]QBP58632.1 hypothetical protein E2R23_28590 [Burkholderia pseudomallei]